MLQNTANAQFMKALLQKKFFSIVFEGKLKMLSSQRYFGKCSCRKKEFEIAVMITLKECK